MKKIKIFPLMLSFLIIVSCFQFSLVTSHANSVVIGEGAKVLAAAIAVMTGQTVKDSISANALHDEFKASNPGIDLTAGSEYLVGGMYLLGKYEFDKISNFVQSKAADFSNILSVPDSVDVSNAVASQLTGTIPIKAFSYVYPSGAEGYVWQNFGNIRVMEAGDDVTIQFGFEDTFGVFQAEAKDVKAGTTVYFTVYRKNGIYRSMISWIHAYGLDFRTYYFKHAFQDHAYRYLSTNGYIAPVSVAVSPSFVPSLHLNWEDTYFQNKFRGDKLVIPSVPSEYYGQSLRKVLDYQASQQNSLEVWKKSIESSINENAADITELKVALKNLRNSVTSLSDVVNSTNEKMKTFDQKFNLISGQLDGFNQRLGSISGQVDGLNQRVGSISGQVDGFNDRLGSISGQVDGLNQRVGSISGQVDGFNDRLGSISGQVDSLGGEVGTLAEKLDQTNERVGQIERDWVSSIPILGTIVDLIREIIALLTSIYNVLLNLQQILKDFFNPANFTLDFSVLKVDFSSTFPFSIPFDFLKGIKFFSVAASAPVLRVKIDYLKLDHTIDLGIINYARLFFRSVVIVWYSIFLMMKTRDLIKW